MGFGLHYRHAPRDPECVDAFPQIVADAHRLAGRASACSLGAYVGIWPDAVDIAANEAWRWEPGRWLEPVLILADPVGYLEVLDEALYYEDESESDLKTAGPSGWNWISWSPRTNDFPYQAIGQAVLLRAAALAPSAFCVEVSTDEWEREWTYTHTHDGSPKRTGARAFYEAVFGEAPDASLVCSSDSCRHAEVIAASGPVFEADRAGRAFAAARTRRHVRGTDAGDHAVVRV